MRKVIRFLPEAPPGGWADRWADALGLPGAPAVHGWPGVRSPLGAPTRVALGTALALAGLPPPRFAAVEVLWFDREGAGAISPTDSVVPATNSVGESALPQPHGGAVVVPVEEVVARGASALAHRWAEGGDQFKMMSFGRRNPALTRAEFIERWRAEAGRLGGDRIPDDLRGLAYVQDHPIGDDPPLDAINEVWFVRLDDLRRRAEWFAAHPIPAALISPPDSWSLYLRETVVGP